MERKAAYAKHLGQLHLLVLELVTPEQRELLQPGKRGRKAKQSVTGGGRVSSFGYMYAEPSFGSSLRTLVLLRTFSVKWSSFGPHWSTKSSFAVCPAGQA